MIALAKKWFAPRRGFRGGLFLPDEKAATARRSIEPLPLRGPLHVPQRHASLPTRVIARVGQTVRAGAVLAEADHPDSLSVLAPVCGRLVAITRVRTVDGWADAFTLDPDGRDDWEQSPGPSPDGRLNQIDAANILVAEPRVPLSVLLRRAAATNVDTLIINAMETEPLLTADLRLLVERPHGLLSAIEALAARENVKKVLWAVPDRHGRVLRRLRALTENHRVLVAALADKYPQGHPELLVRALLGREIPPGGSPLDVGALVLPLDTIRALDDWFARGRPYLSRVVTVAGDAVQNPGNLLVPLGTPIGHLLEYVGLRERPALLLAGGPMTGTALPDDSAVVTPDMTGVIAFSARRAPSPVPCVRCGWCVEDCPVAIEPPTLMQLEQYGSAGVRLDDSSRTALARCIECGVCSYVCPADLPLTATIASLRRAAMSSFSRGAAT